MSAPSSPRRRHSATFYGTHESLVFTVSTFVKEGLDAGEPALVIAIPEHRVAIATALHEAGVDVAAETRRGNVVLLDAEEVMGAFMVGASPDAGAFDRVVGGMMRQLQRGRRRRSIRAYGEIVNVLWQQGATEAAIQVEMLWNSLASRFEVSLLCGYAMGNFFKHAESLRDVCGLHTHVSDVGTVASYPNVH